MERGIGSRDRGQKIEEIGTVQDNFFPRSFEVGTRGEGSIGKRTNLTSVETPPPPLFVLELLVPFFLFFRKTETKWKKGSGGGWHRFNSEKGIKGGGG